MPWEFVCSRCENIHDVPHIQNPPDVERKCEGCDADGCVDCMFNGWCDTCDLPDIMPWDDDEEDDLDDPWNDPSIP